MSKIAPVRFVIFVVLLIAGTALAGWLLEPLTGAMIGFDFAAAVFLASHLNLLDDDIVAMRKQSKENDANRAVLLAISVAATIVVLLAVGAVITKSHGLGGGEVAMIIGTLALAWLFGNVVYALHYAHIYYQRTKGEDVGGIAFPGTREPDYWDFLYFSFTLGMTFQTSDCDVTSASIRRVTIGHCMAAFVFNLGVLAFTINALGS
ncbi:MAG TPA: DUF1345 domain-containing protein [Sphingomicrobium sp.]|nr:DUF1345 domain-containing protein [Sphingomicrobium sp.]